MTKLTMFLTKLTIFSTKLTFFSTKMTNDNVSHLRVPQDQGEAEGLEGGQRPQGSRGDFSFYPLEPCERQKDDLNLS